ncbi:MAG: nitroreductase family protein [Syntrophomonadaceae bacterium]|nr:nitroreductase family protein [Syntrophomonadaceae bacterium]MDH7496879.1 nitroreductase family protein [Syntrophomonadaceae bacterium]
MNETIRVLLERRSIRSYLPDQVQDSDLELILEAGRYAPSGGNAQPWHFTVVQDPALLEKMVVAARERMLGSGVPRLVEAASKPNYSCFHHAPTVIIVSGGSGYCVEADCANAAENMVIAATALGLGSCYTASFVMAFDGPEGPNLRRELRIPDGYRPMFAICLGYTAGEKPPAPPRREGVVDYLR